MNVGEENRNGRRGNDSKGASQQRQPGGLRDGTPNSNQSKRGGKSSSNVNRSADNTSNGPSSQTSVPPPDDHVPIAGFNAEAVEAMLKQGYATKAPLYKQDSKPQTAKSDGPWGAKPGAMANGKDFWLDLRKQVAALQQSGGTSRGG
ncbi:hypothetical protein LTR10_020966 [Elasticomyces elasticus]|uniref:Uncharacterized protein n=1 Tax=Exophiala sideris TaxID=1016849 RepID=A0ABR0J928_9EURO|nr:hypothetical protein LTR10_020966 [Elasticomyces elasticus]KAK5027932.1 hypothetical protein LTS07_006808 [Exophiala sideris]KAK5037477.1 hypothetical protein LTR13_004634 [Exophiala sideris]KAK5059138.1 hypothetical protein LTR69_006427 [Exophiala sideris]KAK5182972.1 hypothetical protein LTR44_004682 [Eurotiomycetes sp. CCFEE 6388]